MPSGTTAKRRLYGLLLAFGPGMGSCQRNCVVKLDKALANEWVTVARPRLRVRTLCEGMERCCQSRETGRYTRRRSTVRL